MHRARRPQHVRTVAVALFFFFSSRRRHTRFDCDWSSDVCSSDLLKANQKFPDYMDVGIDVWEHMHDWHVRTRQPLTIVRTNDGRYGMLFGVTTDRKSVV